MALVVSLLRRVAFETADYWRAKTVWNTLTGMPETMRGVKLVEKAIGAMRSGAQRAVMKSVGGVEGSYVRQGHCYQEKTVAIPN